MTRANAATPWRLGAVSAWRACARGASLLARDASSSAPGPDPLRALRRCGLCRRSGFASQSWPHLMHGPFRPICGAGPIVARAGPQDATTKAAAKASFYDTDSPRNRQQSRFKPRALPPLSENLTFVCPFSRNFGAGVTGWLQLRLRRPEPNNPGDLRARVAYRGARPDASTFSPNTEAAMAFQAQISDPRGSRSLGCSRRLRCCSCSASRPARAEMADLAKAAAWRLGDQLKSRRPALRPRRPGRQGRAAADQHQAARRSHGDRDQALPAPRRHRCPKPMPKSIHYLIKGDGAEIGQAARPKNSATTPARSTRSRSNPISCSCSMSRATTRASAA